MSGTRFLECSVCTVHCYRPAWPGVGKCGPRKGCPGTEEVIFRLAWCKNHTLSLYVTLLKLLCFALHSTLCCQQHSSMACAWKLTGLINSKCCEQAPGTASYRSRRWLGKTPPTKACIGVCRGVAVGEMAAGPAPGRTLSVKSTHSA